MVTRAEERQEGNDKKSNKNNSGDLRSERERHGKKESEEDNKRERLRFSFSGCRWIAVIVEALEAERRRRVLR